MWYLFFQVWILLLISFVLGWCVHWFLCCRSSSAEPEVAAIAPVTSTTTVPVAEQPVDVGIKPVGLASAPDNADDLKRVKGIGNVIEKTLNELGVYRFDQIADWTTSNVSWVENYIAFPGRIVREEWVSQAKTLGAGGSTDFAKRVDKGELDYDG